MQTIVPGNVVTFTEYELSQITQRKRVIQRLENMIVEAVIAPNEFLTRERIDELYGPDISNQERHALATSIATRLVLRDDEGNRYYVNLMDSFLKTGLQSIEVLAAIDTSDSEAPSYLNFLNAFGPAVPSTGETAHLSTMQ